MQLEILNSFEATPVPLSPLDTIAAMREGRVEGFAQSPFLTLALGWAPTIKYFTLTRHSYQLLVGLFSRQWFYSQPKDIQRVLLANRQEATERSRLNVRDVESSVVLALASMGIKIGVLSQQQFGTFSEFASRIRSRNIQHLGAGGKRVLKAIADGKAAYKKKK